MDLNAIYFKVKNSKSEDILFYIFAVASFSAWAHETDLVTMTGQKANPGKFREFKSVRTNNRSKITSFRNRTYLQYSLGHRDLACTCTMKDWCLILSCGLVSEQNVWIEIQENFPFF